MTLPFKKSLTCAIKLNLYATSQNGNKNFKWKIESLKKYKMLSAEFIYRLYILSRTGKYVLDALNDKSGRVCRAA